MLGTKLCFFQKTLRLRFSLPTVAVVALVIPLVTTFSFIASIFTLQLHSPSTLNCIFPFTIPVEAVSEVIICLVIVYFPCESS